MVTSCTELLQVESFLKITFQNFCWEILVKIELISYLCGMNQEGSSEQSIRTIIQSPIFTEFYDALPPKVQTKFDYVLDVMANVYNISTKFVKHLQNTDLYEMRVSVGTNEYRTVLFAIDHTNVVEAKTIILLNSFLKKDNKNYRKQIEIAATILKSLEL